MKFKKLLSRIEDILMFLTELGCIFCIVAGLTLITLTIWFNEGKARTYRSCVDVTYQVEGDTTVLATSLMEDITIRSDGKINPVYFISNRMHDDTIDPSAFVVYGKLLGNGDEEYMTHNVLVKVPGKKINILQITTDCQEVQDTSNTKDATSKMLRRAMFKI